MKVAFLVNDIHLGGGGERVTVNLANAFTAIGFSVSIISFSSLQSNKTIFNLSREVRVDYLGIQNKFNFVRKYESVRQLQYFLKRNEMDCVLGIGNYPSLALSMVREVSGVQKIGCMHLSFNAIPFVWRILAQLFFRRLDALTSLTKFDQAQLLKLNSVVEVIPNSTSFSQESCSNLTHKRILALGRLVDEKDFATMIVLFERFCEMDASWTLRIRGKGPLEGELRKQIEESKWGQNIELLPPTVDVETEYLNTSIVLLTSKYEGLPMVLIEAQSFGIPVISFDCETGPAEIIVDGVTGYLIDPNKKEEMVKRLVELTADIEKRKEMGRQAKIHSERFSEEKIMEQWLQLFQKLEQQ